MGTADLAHIKVPWQVDLGGNYDGLWLPETEIAKDNCHDNHYSRSAKEHEGSCLVSGNVADGGNHEHESEKACYDCKDGEENCDTGERSHMREFASFRLLSFRVPLKLGIHRPNLAKQYCACAWWTSAFNRSSIEGVWVVPTMVRLQVALDFENLSDALKMAELVAPYVDIMEVGTPLIKAEGIGAVKAIKKTYPEKAICADLKTADTGYLEVRMAAQASANIVTVLADAYNETLKGALKAAHEFGVEIMADLIVSRIPISRLADILGLDYKGTTIHYACVHSGLDRRAARRAPLSELDQVARLRGHPCLAVAGGIRVADLPQVLAYPVEIVIAGGGITKAKNPARAAQAFQKKIRQLTKTE